MRDPLPEIVPKARATVPAKQRPTSITKGQTGRGQGEENRMPGATYRTVAPSLTVHLFKDCDFREIENVVDSVLLDLGKMVG